MSEEEMGPRPRENDSPQPLSAFPTRPAHMRGWPEPVHEALDVLVDRAAKAGFESNRSEVTAALIVAAASNHPANAKLKDVLSLYHRIKIEYGGPNAKE